MKISPIDIILNKDFKFDKKFYFISGNEITLMKKIKDLLIKSVTNKYLLSVENVKSISSISNDISLFSKNKCFVINDLKGVDANSLEDLSLKEDIFIFFLENNPKINAVKKIFLERGDSFLLDCYELTKELKIKIINNFVNLNNIKLDQDAFWKLVDQLDTKYMLLENELEKIAYFKEERVDLAKLNKIISREDTVSEKIYFEILSSNDVIINKYNLHITNNIDVNKMYYTFKHFSNMILNNDHINDFEKNIPKYLFKEKSYLIKIYNKITINKKKMLLDLLFKTENVIRKNGNLSIVLGLRFVLNYKKIVTSLSAS